MENIIDKLAKIENLITLCFLEERMLNRANIKDTKEARTRII